MVEVEALGKEALLRINEAIPYKSGEGVVSDANLDFVVYRTGATRGVNRKAAVLMKSLVESHAFRDGNKRTAFVAAKALLEANGKRLDRIHEYTKIEFTLAVAGGKVPVNKMAMWFANHSRK
ncbi:MAG: type II toxin-antitoxin system death-on-curing family toxin [Candidatus Diapherotrites archaeon]|nr:type II toxin-antitoxin system death-on-curing family toxin [Candidatus Diapherotrites archaeon]